MASEWHKKSIPYGHVAVRDADKYIQGSGK